MLNEFAYCPRLGYLEFVHGEWEDNFETTNGTFGHRRVDKPDRQTIKSPAATVQSSESSAQSKVAIDSSDQPAQLGELGDSGSPTSTDSPTPSPAGASRPSSPAGASRPSSPAEASRPPSAEGAPAIHAMSIMLSAPEERLIAKLDLLELEGLNATPVDYKRGKAPRGGERVYEPEEVQLCAQGLVLRENGFQCDHGVLYFIGSKKRVTIPFTDELIARTRQLRDEFLQVSAGTDVPPPLVDSPKCPRCSLVGICLPDEVVFLKAAGFRDSGFGVQEQVGTEVGTEVGEVDEAIATINDLGVEDSPTSSHLATPSPAGASRPPSPAGPPVRPSFGQTKGLPRHSVESVHTINDLGV